MKLYTIGDINKISNNMITYGGSFVKALGLCIQKADFKNKSKLVCAFPEYCEDYLNKF